MLLSVPGILISVLIPKQHLCGVYVHAGNIHKDYRLVSNLGLLLGSLVFALFSIIFTYITLPRLGIFSRRIKHLHMLSLHIEIQCKRSQHFWEILLYQNALILVHSLWDEVDFVEELIVVLLWGIFPSGARL